MSKFFALKMAREVVGHPMINEEKHLFGLIHNAIYSPTSSEVESYSNFYKENEALLLKQLIENSNDNFQNCLNSLKEVQCSDGSNYRLDLCISHDAKFIAMQLNHVADKIVTHITPIRYFEGIDAQAVENIFD